MCTRNCFTFKSRRHARDVGMPRLYSGHCAENNSTNSYRGRLGLQLLRRRTRRVCHHSGRSKPVYRSRGKVASFLPRRDQTVLLRAFGIKYTAYYLVPILYCTVLYEVCPLECKIPQTAGGARRPSYGPRLPGFEVLYGRFVAHGITTVVVLITDVDGRTT